MTNTEYPVNVLFTVNTNITEPSTGNQCYSPNVYGCAFFLATVGILGNVLTLVVTTSYRPRSIYTTFLAVLSVADGFVCSTTFITSSINLACAYHEFKSLATAMGVAHDIAQMSSNWILVTMTVDRYLAINKLFSRALTKTRLSAVLLCILAGSCIIVPLRFLSKNKVQSLVYSVSDITVRYAIPLIILFILNIRLVHHVNKARREHEILLGPIHVIQREASVKDDTQPKSKNSKTHIVILVVVVFLICGTLRGAVMIIDKACVCLADGWFNVSWLLMKLNSSINFLIYVLFYKRFRDQLKLICHCTAA